VTAEKAARPIADSMIRNIPHRGTLNISSIASMYLKVYKIMQKILVSLIPNKLMKLNLIIFNYYCTVLSAGGAVCSRSVVSACDRTVPQRCGPVPVPVPVPPVGLSQPHNPVLM
jgi:hypothetical protein